MLTCGSCFYCSRGVQQFCTSGRMIGKSANGGFAEYLVVPAQNAFLLPDEIPLEHGAVMMCSSATAYHALFKARLKYGETAAIFGLGGLGMSAIQLAKVFGAFDVFGVDTNEEKLNLAEKLGAIPVNAGKCDPVATLRQLTSGKGVDVSIELIGLPQTIQQAIQSLAIFGRAVLVGISDIPIELFTYRDVLWREAEIIGCADHLVQEIPTLIETIRRGMLDLNDLVTCTIPLDEKKINATLDELERFTSKKVRTVIVP
jgi:2-desacetyl-2-hydroxyethyl bacteriochlorophyllide A dehydrogenase